MDAAQALRGGIEKFRQTELKPSLKLIKSKLFEHDLDEEYLNAKTLFVKYGGEINCGAMVIFDDLVEFIEHAADMCADTADYIVILSSRE